MRHPWFTYDHSYEGTPTSATLRIVALLAGVVCFVLAFGLTGTPEGERPEWLTVTVGALLLLTIVCIIAARVIDWFAKR